MKKLFLALITLLVVLSLSACGTKFTNIDNDELREMLASDVDYYFIDVRTRDEYDTAHIDGFDILIDYYILEDDQSILDQLDTSRPVVIMCNSGNRSVSASNIFLDYGFTEVYNLTDGIEGWDGATTAD